MEVIVRGGVGTGETVSVVVKMRHGSDRIPSSINSSTEQEEFHQQYKQINLAPRGRYMPCKLPIGYKTEK